MTKTAKHSLLFRLWIRLRGLIALIIVLFGVIVGLISLILPNEALYKSYIVNFLSKQTGKPVEIENISGAWQGFGPNFTIQGLHIKAENEIVVQSASLYVNLFQYLMPHGSTGINLGINEIDIDFERKTSGQIVLTGESKKNTSVSNEIDKLLSSGTLSVDNLKLNLYDSIHNRQTRINSHMTVQQNQTHRAFVLALDSPTLADKFTLKSVTKLSDDFMSKASWYVQVENLSLHYLGELINKTYLPNTQVDAQMWATTEKGNIVELIIQAELKETVLGEKSDISATAELVYKGNNQNWLAELTLNDVQTKSIAQQEINITLARKDEKVYLRADVLDVTLLKAITQIINISNQEFDQLALDGKLTDVQISYDVEKRRLVDSSIQFQHLDVEAELGNFTQLSGEISLHDEQIRLLLDSDMGTAVLPKYIRGQVSWDKLLLTAQTSMQDDNLDFKINSLWCDCQDFILDGAARITMDDSVFMDLTFAVYEAQVNQLYKYWPIIPWSTGVLEFLDRALVSGVVQRGMILYHGMPEQYPFVGNQGKFATHSHLANAHIDYHQDWPDVEQFDAIVTTLNRNLQVKSKQGKVIDGNIDSVTAEIKNLKKSDLHVDIQASGKDNFLIDILHNSPMREGLNLLKQDILLKGQQKVKVALEIPLKNPNIQGQPVGEIAFIDTDFQLGAFALNDLNGIMQFSGFSLFLKQIQANFLNQEVTLSGEIINQPNQDVLMNVLIKGIYEVKNFATLLGFDLNASGQSAWQFAISNKNATDISFSAQSDLLGTELNLPQPFSKAATQTTDFSINCLLPCVDGRWEVAYADTLYSQFNFEPLGQKLTLNKLQFGQMDDVTTAKADFGGHIEFLDVDKWLELISQSASDKAFDFSLSDINVSIGTVVFMSRELHDVSLKLQQQQESLVFEVSGEQIEGKIILADDIVKKGIVVQLNKLHWLDPITTPETQSISKVSSKYPALHIWIGDFIYDGIPLGEASIEVRPVLEGVKVEKFTTKSNLMQLDIKGNWYKDRGANGTSEFDIILSSQDIAGFLSIIGFAAPISQAQTLIDMQAKWPGFPSQFETKNISGSMRIEIGEGEVVDAKPGMGRVLGLFSLTNLPRRLILDFKDVFGKGLHFNSMQGDFILNNGEAYTESFVIDSSGAGILIKGSTGLDKQDYNQVVIVTPRVGRTLPTIGAIAGGPVGAAAGFLAQGVFGKGLKKASKIIYKVTGSWDNPLIELIETEEQVHEN